MDPQHRLLLSTAAELLSPHLPAPQRQAAACLPADATGVYVGISWNEYSGMAKAQGASMGPYAAQGAVLR